MIMMNRVQVWIVCLCFRVSEIDFDGSWSLASHRLLVHPTCLSLLYLPCLGRLSRLALGIQLCVGEMWGASRRSDDGGVDYLSISDGTPTLKMRAKCS